MVAITSMCTIARSIKEEKEEEEETSEVSSAASEAAAKQPEQEESSNKISCAALLRTSCRTKMDQPAITAGATKSRAAPAVGDATKRIQLLPSRKCLLISLFATFFLITYCHDSQSRPNWHVAAQCPWTRDLVALHSDCICDLVNPSITSPTASTASSQQSARMSVQCSMVDFYQLLVALKKTASIELPKQLVKEILPPGGSTAIKASLDDGEDDERTQRNQTMRLDELLRASNQLALQAKLDLLHVSNSTIGRLVDNTFLSIATASSKLQVAVQTTTVAGEAGSDNDAGELLLQMDTNRSSDKCRQKHLVVAIQSLHLSRCGIEQVESGAFRGLEWTLTSLSLSDNQLEFVPKDAIGRLVNLKVLDLSNNKLIRIQANSFVTLNRLATLRLADNRIGRHQEAQQRQDQHNDSGYTTSNTDNNNNSTAILVDLLAFRGLETSLNDLNLKNTQLSAFPLAVKSLHNLAFLNLAQNQISQLPPKAFEQLSSLTAINLERNRISQLEEDTFVGVESSLSSLSLMGNLLETFPSTQLARLDALRRLDLGFNGIEALPSDAFNSSKRLILVALDGNPLETLPEEAFKPLEGTLRGMSIGGKALNCDCRLSWMLRWQQKYNIQISSRERKPQFCSKPHYLRSLVSFASLKPEHLSCSSLASQEPTIHYIPILRRASNSSSTSSTGWIAQSDKASVVATNHPFTLFTMPFQYQTEPTMSPTVKLSQTISSSPKPAKTTMSNRGAFSAAALATTTTTPPELPATTRAVDQTESTRASNSAIQEIASTTPSGPIDLTESSTNEEPTLRSDQLDVTTSLPTIDSSQTAQVEQAAIDQQSEFATKDTTIVPISEILPHLMSFGERTLAAAATTTGITTNSFTSAAAVATVAPSLDLVVVSNGLGQLPENELLLIDPSRQKLNRHGFLPSQNRLLYKGSTAGDNNGQPIAKKDTTNQSIVDDRSPRHDGQNLTRIFGIIEPEFNRTRQNKTNAAASDQQATLSESSSSTSSTTSTAIPNTSTTNNRNMRPIYSVFGNRAGDNNLQTRENRRAGSHGSSNGIARTASNNFPLSSSSSSVVAPAVPTTISVYKANNQHLLSANSNQPATTTTTNSYHYSSSLSNEKRPLDSLNKGARFVDDENRQVLSFDNNNHRTSSPLAGQHFDSDDIERYSTQASTSRSSPSMSSPTNQQTRQHQQHQQLTDSTIELSRVIVEATTARVNAMLEPTSAATTQMTTTTTSASTTSRAAPAVERQPTTTVAPPSTTTSRAYQYANNTRMSVSSMYRLSARLLPSSLSVTKEPSTYVSSDSFISVVRPSQPSSTGSRDTDSISVGESSLKTKTAQQQAGYYPREPAITRSDTELSQSTVSAARGSEDVLTETATTQSGIASMTTSQIYNRSSWLSSDLIGTPTTTTSRPPVSLTPVAAVTDLQPATTTTTSTSMSATVRFIDSSPQSRRVINQQHHSSVPISTSTTTTTTTTTTARPQALVQTEPSLEPLVTTARLVSSAPVLIIAPSPMHRKLNEPAISGHGRFVEKPIGEGRAGAFESSLSRDQSSTMTSSNNERQSETHPPNNQIRVQQQRGSYGEQQHEARITLITTASSNRQIVASNLNTPTIMTTTVIPVVAEAASTPPAATSGEDLQPSTTTSSWRLTNLITKGAGQEAQNEADGDKRNNKPGGSSIGESDPDSSGGGLQQGSGGKQARFLGNIVKLADYDQLALILAALLCLLILIFTFTVVCIWYSTPASTTSVANGGLDAVARQQRQQQDTTMTPLRLSSFSSGKLGPATIGANESEQKQTNLLIRLLCCLMPASSANGSNRVSVRSKHVTPMRALILQDDEHSSGESSSNGLKSNGKSMLLARHPSSGTTSILTSQDLLLGPIQRSSTRVARGQRGKMQPHERQQQQQRQRRSAYESSTKMSSQMRTIKRHRSYVFDNNTFEQDFADQQQNTLNCLVDAQQQASRAVGRRHSILLPADSGCLNSSSSSSQRNNNSKRSQDDNEIVMLDHRRRDDLSASDWAMQTNDVETLSSCDSDKSCSPGANKNNRYNISDAHRAYLSDKGAQQVQASMFVTTAGGRQQRHSKSGLLKTIEHASGASNRMMQQQQSDYFDCLSGESASDKSTTDDSRAPLDSGGSSRRTDKNLCLPKQQRFGAHQAQRRSTMRNASISFEASVVRSRSFGRQQQRQAWPNCGQQHQVQIGPSRQPPAELVATRVGSECDDYQNSELLPMSAEDQWPEPYVDPVEEPTHQHQLQQAFSYSAVELTTQQQYPGAATAGSIDQYQQQRSQYQDHQEHQQHHHHHNQQQQQNLHKRPCITGSGAQDDAYQVNWRTMSKSKQRHQQQPVYCNGQLNHQTAVPGAVLGGGNNLIQYQQHMSLLNDDHSAAANSSTMVGNSATSLTRYRSIPSLSGLLSDQAPGASSWLRWTPPPPLTSFVSSDQQKQQQADATLQQVSCNTGGGGNGANEGRSWHRDNHIEAMYVATNRQQL